MDKRIKEFIFLDELYIGEKKEINNYEVRDGFGV